MCDRLRASFIESSFFGSRRFQAGLAYLPPLSVKPLRVAPAEPGVYLWELCHCSPLEDELTSMFNRQIFKRYLANTSWLIVEQIVSRLIALFLSIYVARYLGPEQFGLLNYALSLVGRVKPILS